MSDEMPAVGGQELVPRSPREIPPPALLPKGWKAIEYTYQTGSRVGLTYVRYHSDFPGAKNLSSIMRAVEMQAKHDGRDVEQALREYEEARAAQKALEATEKAALSGVMKAADRDRAIAVFRDKYGQLDGATVAGWPNWRREAIFQPNCGQTRNEYFDPTGHKWLLMKDVEGHYGQRMIDGEDLSCFPELEELAKVNSETPAKVKKRRAQRTQAEEGSGGNGDDDPKAVPTPTPRKCSRRAPPGTKSAKVSFDPEHYRECPSFGVVAVPESGLSEGLKRRLGEDSRRTLMALRRTEDNRDCVAVVCEPLVSPVADLLTGIYRRHPDAQGRVCYQRADAEAGGEQIPPRQPLYILWSPSANYWKVGSLDNDKAGFAYVRYDSRSPVAIPSSVHWHVLEA